MVRIIMEMLEIAKDEKLIGPYTHIALGKHYLSSDLKETYQQAKYETWAK